MSFPGPIQVTDLSPEDLQDPALVRMNNYFRTIAQRINYLLGLSGPISMQVDIDMQGNNIHNLGTPGDPADALCETSADPLYGADVQRTNMSAVGTKLIATTRQLNSRNQKEKYSTFLNDTLSTPPGGNGASITFITVSPSITRIIVSADETTLADKSVIPFATRNDTVSNPTSFTIAAAPTGAVRTSGIATITTTAPHGLGPGQFANVSVTGDPSFNGDIRVATVPSPTQITYANPGPNTTNGGGALSLGGVYYYFLRSQDNTLQMAGPFLTDTAQNRITANYDGQQFVAVATVTAAGGSPDSSGGGGDDRSGGGCTEVGTPLAFPENSKVSMELVPCDDWVEIEVAGGARVAYAPNTLVSVFVRVQDLEPGSLIEGELGQVRRVTKKEFTTRKSSKQVVRVSPQQTYHANGLRTHNAKTI